MEESISLEETNKIRISLGLKPLTDDKAPEKSEDQIAEDNFRKHREKEKQEREKKRIADGIAKVKNKRELNSSLKGATLGDADDKDEDTLKWIKRSRKKQKELAKKRLQELNRMDEASLADYSEKDLAGLKVAHDMEALGEGEEQILTLKDSRILDNEEDELHNVELADHERTKKNNELKIKKRDYTGYDDDEFTGPGGVDIAKKKILAKYDEELEGGTETGFRLGAGASVKATKVETVADGGSVIVNKALLNIDYLKNNEMSDYLQEGDRGFKKPKTKKKRPSRRVREEDETSQTVTNGNGEAMEIDQKPLPKREADLNVNFVDDEDLQAALARQRREKMKERKVLRPEDIARRVAEEKDTNGLGDGDTVIPKEEIEEDEGLVFDDTSEFVRGIVYDPENAKVQQQQPSSAKQAVKVEGTNGKVKEDLGEDKEELELGEVDMKEEEMEEAVLHAMQLDEVQDGAADVKKEDDIGTSSEQTYGTGLAGTLAILKQAGILKPLTAEERAREQIQRDRDRWLAEHRAREQALDQARIDARLASRDQPTREYDNRRREQMETRLMQESFKDYKPDVNIVYHDEFGRSLTPKEAWKALSHRFHGKGSGKAKTEKRLKKISDEKKKEAMVSGDTPSSMNKAFQARQEKVGQAHMVLSVGNRGAAPQVAEFLDTPQLSKKGDKKGKRKGQSSNGDGINGAGGVDPTSISRAATGTPDPQSISGGVLSIPPSGFTATGSGAGSPAPMMKASFARIGNSMEPNSGIPTPTGTERTKLSIGLKRKVGDAEMVLGGEPPSKKR